MRWTRRKPENGATRVVRKFLLIPLRLEGETRWLETADIRQKAMGTSMIGEPPHPDSVEWVNIGWVRAAGDKT